MGNQVTDDFITRASKAIRDFERRKPGNRPVMQNGEFGEYAFVRITEDLGSG